MKLNYRRINPEVELKVEAEIAVMEVN